jgi:hypothetical protein
MNGRSGEDNFEIFQPIGTKLVCTTQFTQKVGYTKAIDGFTTIQKAAFPSLGIELTAENNEQQYQDKWFTHA